PEGDPLSDFILNHRAAHCQYFASALVVMARAIGVPARFVTGYYAHEAYGAEQTVVRQRDAHAWAECWIDGLGWITLDATAAGGLPDRQFQDASMLRRTWERITDLPGRLRDWVAQFSRRALVTFIITSAGLVIIAWLVRVLLASRLRKRGMNGLAYARPSEELIAAAKRFEAWLKDRGRPCRPNQTWREHVAALADARCDQFVDAYDRARFGGANGEVIAVLHQLLGKLENRPPSPRARGEGREEGLPRRNRLVLRSFDPHPDPLPARERGKNEPEDSDGPHD
ncbi:MAG TPA: transglutaminase-like domain-containing protein, partial [Tepidisphaeraceae bacterium]